MTGLFDDMSHGDRSIGHMIIGQPNMCVCDLCFVCDVYMTLLQTYLL